MRSSNKSRSRNKNSNRRNSSSNSANVVNRVFDSAGPEGRVRGTPQQIIEKYSALAHDAMLADDRVAAESFQQHAEHYSRILQKAQRQIAERQAEQQAQQAQRQQQQQQQQQQQEAAKVDTNEQPDVSAVFEGSTDQPDADENLVATPENKPRPPRNRSPRGRRPAKDAAKVEADSSSDEQPQPS